MNLPAMQTHEPRLELARSPTLETEKILTPEALRFVALLAERFTPALKELLAARRVRQQAFDQGAVPDFDPDTAEIRESDWRVAPIPAEVLDRRTEITGPVSRKMVINALNSSAQVYMADFEDSTSPTWTNIIDGQVNLRDAIRRQIDFSTPEGKSYALKDRTAVLMVRPRGLHLPEQHLRLEGRPVPGALVDFGLFLFHNHEALEHCGSRPYFYLPKLEHAAEAAWWEEVISFAEQELGIAHGTVKVTILIETLMAVFQMHEILHALRDRILGLNCGRWDYIFSYIKTLRNHPDRVLPDRDQVGMTVPFLRAYSQLLIETCHRRGAFAMGGMAAQIPIRADEAANAAALEKVRADKRREAGDGHDGTWVAHPGLEPLAREEFDKVLDGPNQIDRRLEGLDISAELLIQPSEGSITEEGVRKNIRAAIQYLAAWMQGNGCVPINNLMEDAATAEIGRTQLWQWSRHGARLEDGRVITHEWLDLMFDVERKALITSATNGQIQAVNRAVALLQAMTRSEELVEFLTLPAYWQLND